MLTLFCNSHAKPFRGGRPLHLAARQGHQHVVEKLLAANADVEAQDTQGRVSQFGVKTSEAHRRNWVDGGWSPGSLVLKHHAVHLRFIAHEKRALGDRAYVDGLVYARPRTQMATLEAKRGGRIKVFVPTLV